MAADFREMHTVHMSTGAGGSKINHPSVWHDYRLHEPACEWLNERIVPQSQSSNTWAQAARSIATWLDFLEASSVDWNHASRDDLVSYRDAYLSAVSPQTGQRYSPQTVRTRMVYIIEFVEYSVSRGWLNSDMFGDPTVMAQEAGRHFGVIDQDTLAHTRKGGIQFNVGRVLKLLPRGSHDETVRVLRKEELVALLRWAGPRASQRTRGDGGSDRDRVLLDIAWTVGLRVDEISRLTVHPFEALTPDPRYPGESFNVSVIGKGNKKRLVDIAAWVVLDIQAYCQGERRRCLRRRGPKASENQLILNSESSRNRVGRPMAASGMQALMARACAGAGLMRRIERTNPETGEIAIDSVPRFSLHCLRHTYAVVTYRNSKTSTINDFEAWKYIQMQLGHESTQTTMNIYLKHVTAWSDMRTSRTLLDMVAG